MCIQKLSCWTEYICHPIMLYIECMYVYFINTYVSVSVSVQEKRVDKGSKDYRGPVLEQSRNLN